MDNLHEISEEAIRLDMKKTFGLLLSQDPSVDFPRFILISALDKDDKITNVIPNPEVLRLYAIDREDRVREWVDSCMIENHDMLTGLVLSYAEKWSKMKVVFTTDEFETLQFFTVKSSHGEEVEADDDCGATHNK